MVYYYYLLYYRDTFGQWMEVLRQITESDVPAHTLQVNIKRTRIKIKHHYRRSSK
jgi:hypothetical protein